MSACACFVCFWFGMNDHRQHPLEITLSPFTVLTITYALHCSLAFVCYTSRPQKTAVGLLTLSFVSLYNWLHATPEGQATKIFTAPASLTILWWKPGVLEGSPRWWRIQRGQRSRWTCGRTGFESLRLEMATWHACLSLGKQPLQFVPHCSTVVNFIRLANEQKKDNRPRGESKVGGCWEDLQSSIRNVHCM